MKKNRLAIITFLLIIAIGNFTRTEAIENIRMVGFLSIFVIGLLTGALILVWVDKFQNRNK